MYNNSYSPPSFSLLTPVVKNLVIINILCFLAINSPVLGDFLMRYGAVYYFDSPHFYIWQLVAYSFLHGGFSHIFFNMFALFMFGSMLENYLGSKRFLIYYLLTGIGAIIIQSGVNAWQVYQITGSIFNHPGSLDFISMVKRGYISSNEISIISRQTGIINNSDIEKLVSLYAMPTIGASGSVFGLLLGFGWLFPNATLLIYFLFPVKAKYFVAVYGLIELYLGVSNNPQDNIAHFAHLGGMLVGYVLLKIWRIRRPGFF